MREVKYPDHTVLRVVLWGALHVLEDEIRLKQAAPEDGWRE